MSVEFASEMIGLRASHSGAPVDPAPVNGTSTLQAASPADPFSDERARPFLDALAERLEGELDATRGTRARYSSDAGLYRIPPLAVVFPASTEDILTTLELARAHGIPVTNRGGGTSCSGNAIGPGIVLESARHLNRVVSIDPEARTAVVEPGCIAATLQAAAAPYGLRFGPDPSSQNRATVAGMVGNNACGPHATAWGRTADNIVELDCVDGLGRRFTARREHDPELPEVPGLAALIDEHLAIIRTELGTFGRQVSGYSLEHLTPEGHRNLAAMLVGTEGTLVTVLSITVRLVPVPASPVLVVLGYPDMIRAADDVPALLEHRPLAVEGLDSRLVDVVRRHNGPGAVPELPEGEGWMMCEVGGDSPEDSLERARALADSAHTEAVGIYPPGDDAARLWRIRADGAGLGGRTPYDPATGKGNEQGWPGFEDAAVPPANLGAYLRDFTALMKEFDIDGLLYGHFGDGCVHVRLDMPLDTDEGVEHSYRFLKRAAACCASHGGSVSGEHGDGRARTELLRFMYSREMLDLFGQVKHLFDPDNLLNPGVLASPITPVLATSRGSLRRAMAAGIRPDLWILPGERIDWELVPDPQPGVDLVDDFLRRPASRSLPAAGGFAFREDHGDFANAIHRCTGVGKCRAGVSGAFMCPSWKATKDEKDVTRGRARTLQEAANGALVASIASPEVLEALDLCLACKACSSDCPAGVDMAKYRSEAFFRRYRGRLRPLSHYALGMLPRWTRLSARIPGAAGIANALLGVGALRRAVFSLIGLDARRPMLPLQSGTFERWARRRGSVAPAPPLAEGGASAAEGAAPSTTAGGFGPRDPQGRPYVLVWADSFSQTLDDTGARALVELLEANGFAVIVASDVCCGLTWITTGQLAGAKKRLGKLLGALAPFAANGIPIVGVEPSCTAVLRDDLLDLLPDDPRSALVSGRTFTLAELLALVPEDELSLPDLSGVEVVAQPHCHHYSVMGWAADRALLTRLGASVTELSGCCGLAGNFGMEKGHYEVSAAVAGQSLLPALEEHPDAVYLADGFSCRTQAAQLAGRRGVHLATLLGGGS
ncbi:FAD-binding and (Fe-S)-binding domain-containing protein [Schaalia sp.]|uniref:FAD-binding and (Fe-S)-binding domain-containing protein n=1 Tax=Schaalia sp. TaxID=2691890 RepID=UPI003D0DEC20